MPLEGEISKDILPRRLFSYFRSKKAYKINQISQICAVPGAQELVIQCRFTDSCQTRTVRSKELSFILYIYIFVLVSISIHTKTNEGDYKIIDF